MYIIQIRLEEGDEEGQEGGYFNYEFGTLVDFDIYEGMSEASFHGADERCALYTDRTHFDIGNHEFISIYQED